MPRPHAFWIKSQPIDPAGPFRAMQGGGKRAEKPNRWAMFRKSFFAGTSRKSGTLKITCDGKYRLFINGIFARVGPARCSPLFQRFDEVDLTPFLRPGRNVVAVLVHVYGVDTAWHETVKGMWQPTFGDGALWVAGPAELGLETAEGWRGVESDAWEQDVPRANHALDFIEVLDARQLPEGWTEPGFDDASWPEAQILTWGGGGPEAPFGGMKIEPFTTLLRNDLPPMWEGPIQPKRLLWIKHTAADPALPLIDRLYKEQLIDGEFKIGLQDLIDGVMLRTEPGKDVMLLLDFGQIRAAYPWVELEARGGEMIELAACESLPGEWDAGGAKPDARLRRTPILGNDAHMARYIAKAGAQRFQRFEWAALRYLQVAVRDAPHGVRIKIGATATHYPVKDEGRFECSDPFLTKLWAVGKDTLRQCMHDGWIDCPSRERRQWLGDATVENLAAHVAFGPSIAPLNREFLRKAAESQRPDGLTQMFAPGDHGVNGLLIPDWTLQWILNAPDHFWRTNDRQLIRDLLPSILKALDWFERQRGPSGLIEETPYWTFHDWAGFGRDGISTVTNALYARALSDAAFMMSDVLGNSEFTLDMKRRSRAILGRLKEIAWDETRGVYVDTIDPATLRQRPRVSQHANAALIVADGELFSRIDRICERISDPKRLRFTAAPPITPAGEAMNEEENVVLANTFFSHFVYEALNYGGRTDAAIRLMRERYGPMLEKGATTLWESFAPTASLCHGFSASPVFQLTENVAGLDATARLFPKLFFHPNFLDLDWVRAEIATTMGPFGVVWKRTRDDRIEAMVDLPPEAHPWVEEPKGWRTPTQSFEVSAHRQTHKIVFERTK